MMKIHRLLAPLVLGLTAVTGLATTPAYAAGPDEAMNTEDGDPGGRVEFTKYGDRVRVCDKEADGYSVWMAVYDHDDNDKFVYQLEARKNGTCLEVYANLAPEYNLKEDRIYKFAICLDNGEYFKHYCDYAYWTNNE